MNKTTALFRLIVSILDRYIWEPLFWLLILLLLSGLEELSELRKGYLYVSKQRRMGSAILQILIALILFWYYWFKPGGLHRLISM